MDALILSRLQFVWVIGWHILLPAFTVGSSSYIAFMEALGLITGREVYLRISRYWTRIFAVAFGMGVVSGITMPFQFGTNWSRYSDATANILSPLFAYEALFAFFLEAAFLGVLLFGRDRVPRWVHFIAALMVALGTLLSSFWILAANSWMQTPAGYAMVGGRFYPTDWAAIVFNPSFPYRLAHTVCGFFVTTAFVVLGVAAGLARKKPFEADGRVMMSTTLWLLLGLVPLQMFLGDAHGQNTRRYQPAKLAAIEADWETGSRIPLILFAIPDQKNATNHFAIEVPVLGSLVLTHDPNGAVRGLKEWPADQRATVIFPFFAFRIMVGLSMIMLAVTLIGTVLRFGGRLWRSDWFLRICRWTAPIGFFAVLAGWTTTETGRQPWTVYGLLRTADSVTPSLSTADVAISFAGYAAVYLLMFPAGFLIMRRLIRAGTGAPEAETPVEAGRPSHPVDALPMAGPQGEPL